MLARAIESGLVEGDLEPSVKKSSGFNIVFRVVVFNRLPDDLQLFRISWLPIDLRHG